MPADRIDLTTWKRESDRAAESRRGKTCPVGLNKGAHGTRCFCSELVAEALQRVGLLPTPSTGLSLNNYIPANFTSAFRRARLVLLMGYSLSAAKEKAKTQDEYVRKAKPGIQITLLGSEHMSFTDMAVLKTP